MVKFSFRLVFLMENTLPEIKTKVHGRILEELLATEPLEEYKDYFFQ